MQVFVSSPRGWAVPPFKDGVAEKYGAEMKRSGLGPTVVHATYLITLGTPDAAQLEKSVETLTCEMRLTNELGALGLIFHPASHRGQGLDACFDQFVNAAQKVLKGAPGDALLMLETSAGSGDHIGSKFGDLGRLIRAIDDPRVAACLDTQHVWAAGYNIADKDGLDRALEEWDREIGLDLLKAVHANDSMKALGSAVDRHDNIGSGLIGREGFATVLSHPALKDVPFYLEVPGADKEGPDKPNVDALKAIREEVCR
jgi:deoxyribonuclease-4